MKKGFTLAELLIALLILGVIATFTIPKVLQSQQNNRNIATAKEVVSMLSGSYEVYKLNGTASATTSTGDMSPYMNYVAVDTTSNFDGVAPCNFAGSECLKLHSGGLLFIGVPAGNDFGGTSATDYLAVFYDPEPNQNGNAITFALYYNGRITTGDEAGVCCGAPADPAWWTGW